MKKTYKILLSFFLILMYDMGFSQSVPSYVPTNGLVGWWGFNGNAQDGSGNGNHGFNITAQHISDRFGSLNSAIQLGGGVIQLPSTVFQFSRNSSFTVSLWFTHEATGNARLISTENNVGNYVGNFRIANASWSTIHGDFATQFGDYLFDTLVNPHQWNHLVYTYSNRNEKTYINGNLTNINYDIDNETLNYGSPLCIGANSSAIGNDRWNGKFDDFGIWNRALTQQEITNLYNSQLPAQTSLCLPTITTGAPNSVGLDSALISGNITNEGGSSIILRGICFSTTPNPNMGNARTEDGSGIGSFNTVLRGLISSTTYYARSYAKNSNGVVVYGNEVSFTTGSVAPSFTCGTSTVSDVDNNTYTTRQIGTPGTATVQCWTLSNLKVTKYRNGDNIPTGLSNSAWQNTTAGAYAIYDNNPLNDSLFGKLYNHYAVTDSRGLCPTGWHVPTDAEWTTLENYLGGPSVAGGALKRPRVQPTPGGWALPNIGATNSSGFSALPGGLRDLDGVFNYITTHGWWWSASVSSDFGLWRLLSNLDANSTRYSYSRSAGSSVRCLRD